MFIKNKLLYFLIVIFFSTTSYAVVNIDVEDDFNFGNSNIGVEVEFDIRDSLTDTECFKYYYLRNNADVYGKLIGNRVKMASYNISLTNYSSYARLYGNLEVRNQTVWSYNGVLQSSNNFGTYVKNYNFGTQGRTFLGESLTMSAIGSLEISATGTLDKSNGTRARFTPVIDTAGSFDAHMDASKLTDLLVITGGDVGKWLKHKLLRDEEIWLTGRSISAGQVVIYTQAHYKPNNRRVYTDIKGRYGTPSANVKMKGYFEWWRPIEWVDEIVTLGTVFSMSRRFYDATIVDRTIYF